MNGTFEWLFFGSRRKTTQEKIVATTNKIDRFVIRLLVCHIAPNRSTLGQLTPYLIDMENRMFILFQRKIRWLGAVEWDDVFQSKKMGLNHGP